MASMKITTILAVDLTDWVIVPSIIIAGHDTEMIVRKAHRIAVQIGHRWKSCQCDCRSEECILLGKLRYAVTAKYPVLISTWAGALVWRQCLYVFFVVNVE
jgi:hypothetical protein